MSEYTVGSRIQHAKYGEGMISNVKDNTLEVLFLNGGKLLFQMTDPDIKAVVFPDSKTSVSNPAPINKPTLESKPLSKTDGEYTIGARVMHHEYGEGMVTKVTKNEIEVIFLNDSKYTFLKNSGEITILPSLINKNVNTTKVASPKIPEKPPVTATGIAESKRIFHKSLGEGMITKVSGNEIEVIFLDGSKHLFPKNSPDLLPFDINESAFETKPQWNEQTDSNFEPLGKTSENKLGNQIFHPKYGEGMVTKIHKNEFEVIFVDGTKMTLPKSEFTSKKTSIPAENLSQRKETIPEKEVLPENNISYNNPLIGKQIFHNQLGEALIVGVGNNVYEVMFLDGKKLVLPKNQFTETIISQNIPISKQKNTETPVFIEAKTEIANTERILGNKKTDKKNALAENTNEADEKPNFTIGTIVIHPKHGEGIISFADETEIEVVFKNNKKITYSKTNNELKIKPTETKKKKGDIKTLYKKLFLVEDTITNDKNIDNETKNTLLQEIKDIFGILDAKFQNCDEK